MSFSVFSFIQYRLSALTMFIFFLAFIPMRYRKTKTFVICGASYILATFIDYNYFFSNYPVIYNIPATVIQFILIQGTVLAIARYRDWRSVFVGFSTATFVLPGNLISEFFFFQAFAGVEALCCQILIHAIIFTILFFWFRKPMMEHMHSQSRVWSILCAIPTLIYLAVYSIAAYPSNIYEVPSNFLGVILILLLLVFSYILVIKLFEYEKKRNYQLRNQEILASHIRSLKNEMEVYQLSEEKFAIFRHDLRHKVLIMSSLLESGEKEKLEEMFAKMNKEILEVKPNRFCENVVINGVLLYCHDRAAKRNIDFKCSFYCPAQLPVDEFEMATVLSNLLENAMHACERMKSEQCWIHVDAHIVKEQLLIEVANTFEGELLFDEKKERFVSQGGSGHGFGMRSVEQFAERNGATFDYSVENGAFYTRLLIVM